MSDSHKFEVIGCPHITEIESDVFGRAEDGSMAIETGIETDLVHTADKTVRLSLCHQCARLVREHVLIDLLQVKLRGFNDGTMATNTADD